MFQIAVQELRLAKPRLAQQYLNLEDIQCSRVADHRLQKSRARNCDPSSRVYTEVDFSRLCLPYRKRYGPIHTKETFHG